jgi:hypothetical protein
MTKFFNQLRCTDFKVGIKFEDSINDPYAAKKRVEYKVLESFPEG